MGITPSGIVGSGHVLYEIGFRVIEMPFNSLERFVGLLSDGLGARVLIGAGTVIAGRCGRRSSCEGKWAFFCSRCGNADGSVGALKGGADALKLFPGEMSTPTVVVRPEVAPAHRARGRSL